MKKIYLFLVVLFLSGITRAQVPGNLLYDDSYVHTIEIEFFIPDFWDSLTVHFEDFLWNGTDKKYLPAIATIDGVVMDTVGVRQKGFFSNWGFNGLKKPLKIDFNEFIEGQVFNGLKKVNLQNCAFDPSLMRDKLAYDMMRDFGVPAPRSAYANVYLNGTYWGVYLMVEQMDKVFLDIHYESDEGNLYKCINNTSLDWYGTDFNNYTFEFGKRTNEIENNWDDFIRFVDIINNTPDDQLEDSLRNVFNVEGFLKIFAIDVLSNNWDSYFDHGRNFYVYNNPTDNRFQWLPWDYNLAFASFPVHPFPTDIDGNLKPLTRRIIENDILIYEYISVLCDAMTEVFNPTYVQNFIDTYEPIVAAELVNDTNYVFSMTNFQNSLTIGVDEPNFGFVIGLMDLVNNREQQIVDALDNEGILCGNSPPFVTDYELISEDHIRLFFSVELNNSFQVPSNYVGVGGFNTINFDSPTKAVDLFLSQPMMVGEAYTLTVDNVENLEGISMLESETFNFIFNNTTYPIVISEVLYNPKGSDILEFIELVNIGTEVAQIGGYYIDGGIDYQFPNMTMAPGEVLVLALNESIFENFFNVDAINWSANGLSNSGEPLLIKNASNDIIDEVIYSNELPWPEEADGEGHSMMLCDLSLDNNLGNNWTATSTNDYAGDYGGHPVYATPGVLPCGLTAVDEINNFNIKLSPNPASETFLLEWEEAIFEEAVLINTLGEILSIININNKNDYIWNVAAYPKGVYFIQLNGKEGVQHTARIVIQ